MGEENEQTHPSSIAAASNVYVCVCAGVCVLESHSCGSG